MQDNILLCLPFLIQIFFMVNYYAELEFTDKQDKIDK